MKRLAFRVTILLLCVLAGSLATSMAARAQGPVIVPQLNTASATNGLWQSGSVHLNVNFVHPNGISRAQVFVDGGLYLDRLYRCVYGYPGVTPCKEQGLSEMFPTTRFSNGVHSIRVVAFEAYGAASEFTAPLRIDNTVPAPPSSITVKGGSGWRAYPTWEATWKNPPQTLAPITAVRYALCPSDSTSDPTSSTSQQNACRSGEWTAPNLTELPSPFAVPGPGQWTLRLWLVDAARNTNPDAAAVITPLGYDPTAPAVAGFAPQNPADPTRVWLSAADDGAPLSSGAVEIRRRGTNTWRALATEVRPDGLWAHVNDEKLGKGLYELRGTVVNAAMLQTGTNRDTEGRIKQLRLPLRRGSRLQAGRRTAKVCHGHGAKRRCRWRLQRQVPVDQGRPITLRARLTSGGVPIRNQQLEVAERLRTAGARWTRVPSVVTDAHGRVRYKAPAGPARRLRLRYPGTPHVRGDNATLALDVRARTTLDVNRRDAVNGEYVTFRGRLKGGFVPADGVLVEMQVRSRGKWRTFAQPRTDQEGRWRYQYRFETVSGTARFRFRARIRRQTGYPYVTGSSKHIAVQVHGL